jgi:hypothetical protein
MLRFVVTVLTLSEAVTGYGDTFLVVPLHNKKVQKDRKINEHTNTESKNKDAKV